MLPIASLRGRSNQRRKRRKPPKWCGQWHPLEERYEKVFEPMEDLMRDEPTVRLPAMLAALFRENEQIGFQLASEQRTGVLLRVLAASKPGGHLLELGTGTGVGTAWLLDGMAEDA